MLPVLLGHAFPSILPGGFIGVDIFFVISGFLIASMIADKSLRDTFSTADFYKRRILRIFPALFAMLIITTIAAFIILPPYQLREFGQALFGSSIFSSNILFWLKSGYFDAASEANPLVHTWSLAVEEQFYVVAPLLALLVVRSRKLFYAILALTGLASFVFAEATNNVVPSTYFFFTANRVFELIFGCMVGCAFHSRQMGELKGWAAGLDQLTINAISAVSLGALFWCFFNFGPESKHPGFITLLPVIATGALLAFHTSKSWVHLLLGQTPLVMVGAISYSLYLIHQPLLAFARTLSFGSPSTALLLTLLGFSMILAYLMWRFVEQPFRDYDKFTLKQTFIGGLGVIGFGVVVGLTLHVANGLPQRYSDETNHLTRPDMAKLEQLDASGLPKGTQLVLWGDSHAGMLYPAMRQWAKATGGTAELMTNGGCPPIAGFDNDWRNLEGPRCSAFNEETLEALLARPEGVTIIMAARWPNYLRAPAALDEFGHPWTLASRSIFPASRSSWEGDSTRAAAKALQGTVSALKAKGHKIVLLGTVPGQRLHADDVGFILRGDANRIAALSITRAFHADANAQAERMLSGVSSSKDGPEFVDPADILCGSIVCSYLYQGRMAYRDDNHLNDWGATPVARAILAKAGDPENPVSAE